MLEQGVNQGIHSVLQINSDFFKLNENLVETQKFRSLYVQVKKE